MLDLLDASVWIPLSAQDHVHHARALRYWENEASARVAFCRITALALLRHLTDGATMRHGVRTSGQAWEFYLEWLRLPEVDFLQEPRGVHERLGTFSRALTLGRAQWSDAYLAAFAIEADCRLVTFDRGFSVYPELELLNLEV